MPRFLLPNRSSQHRVAAIALYRALLSRCASAPLPDNDRSSLRNAVVNKYRRNRKLMNAYNLGLAFHAGYEVLDQLDAACAGDDKSTTFIADTLKGLPRRLKLPPPPKPPPPPEDPNKKRLECLPPEKAVLRVRPYKEVSGPRHVPILTSTNGIPFLRIKKPQPPSLSRVIRQKLETRIRLFDRMTLLTNYWMPIAAQEDEWDAILYNEFGLLEDGSGEKWTAPFHSAIIDNNVAHEAWLRKNKEIASQMLRIVDEETALALKEGQKIVRFQRKRKEKAKQ